MLQVQDDQSDRMVLNAPELAAGTALTFTVFQVDNAGGPDLQVGALAVLADADRGEATWSSWFDYERNHVRNGREFKFVFDVEGAGRLVHAAAPAIFHPTQLQLTLVDGEDRPLAGKPYRIEIDGRVLGGQTDAAGSLVENIRAGATEATLVYGDPELWRAPVKLLQMQDPDTLVGAQMRLNNLGLCAPEAVHGNLDEQTERALLRFQALQAIPLTGRLDSVTIAKLRQAHGS
jgi:hypothetical protein